MSKVLLRITAAIAVLILVAVLIVWVHVDRVAAVALTTDLERAGNVPCAVDRVRISLLRGRAEVTDFELSNPPKFSEEAMFSVNTASMRLPLASMLDRPIHIRELTMPAPMVRVEAGQGSSNVMIFLGNVGRHSAAEALAAATTEAEKLEPTKTEGEELEPMAEARKPETPTDEAERPQPPTAETDKPEATTEEKFVRVTIDRLVIEDATVTFSEGIGRPATPINVANLELSEIRGIDGKGVTYGELTGLVLMNLIRKAAPEAELDPATFIPTTASDRLDRAATVVPDIDEALFQDMEETPDLEPLEPIEPESNR